MLRAGATYREVQEALGCGPSFVARWRKRVKQRGVRGVDGRHRGQRPLIRGYRRRRLLELLGARDDDGRLAYSHREIARLLGVSPQTVTRYVDRREIEIPDIHDEDSSSTYIRFFQDEHLDLVGLFLSPRQNIFAFASRGAKPGRERWFDFGHLRDGPGRVLREHPPREIWYGGTRTLCAWPLVDYVDVRGRSLYPAILDFLSRVDARFPQLSLLVADHDTAARRRELRRLMWGRILAAMNLVDTSRAWMRWLREVCGWVEDDMRVQREPALPQGLPDRVHAVVKTARRLPGRALVWVHRDPLRHRSLTARRWLVAEARRLAVDS